MGAFFQPDTRLANAPNRDDPNVIEWRIPLELGMRIQFILRLYMQCLFYFIKKVRYLTPFLKQLDPKFSSTDIAESLPMIDDIVLFRLRSSDAIQITHWV